jgi:hypothetical protein
LHLIEQRLIYDSFMLAIIDGVLVPDLSDIDRVVQQFCQRTGPERNVPDNPFAFVQARLCPITIGRKLIDQLRCPPSAFDRQIAVH